MRAVLAACEDHGARTLAFDGPALFALPLFNPDDPLRSPNQSALIAAVRAADAIVIATPGYHSGVSGLVKNALDLLADLRNDARSYFDGIPVGLIVSGADWPSGGVTLSALRGIVHAMRGWPTPLGIAVNTVEQRVFASDGTICDPAVARMVRTQAGQLTGFSFAARPGHLPPA